MSLGVLVDISKSDSSFTSLPSAHVHLCHLDAPIITQYINIQRTSKLSNLDEVCRDEK